MRNEINILEWVLKSSENLINERRSVEAKATGYLAFVALILAMVIDFFSKVFDKSIEICSLFKSLSFIVFSLTIICGVILMIVCAVILIPKKLCLFKPEKLSVFYEEIQAKEISDKEILESIFEENKKTIEVNNKILDKMDNLNLLASIFLRVLMFLFVIDIFIFLVFMGAIK